MRDDLAPILRRLRALEYAFTHSRNNASQSDRERRLAWCLAYEEAYEAGGEPDATLLQKCRQMLVDDVPCAESMLRSRAEHLAQPPHVHLKALTFEYRSSPVDASRIVRALENVTWADLGVTQETTGG